MTFSQFLLEAPLPDDWDSAIFNERLPFAKRVRYAQERAKKAGTGSSRIAFIIPYNGKETVLKVAKNVKGMAQNEVEAQYLEDWYLKKLDLFIPMIDYDENNNQPTWIHTELAAKVTDAHFKQACGGKLSDLMDWARTLRNRQVDPRFTPKINIESDLAQAMQDFILNYDPLIGDFDRLANWGLYDGKPVILDVGVNTEVMQKYYR